MRKGPRKGIRLGTLLFCVALIPPSFSQQPAPDKPQASPETLMRRAEVRQVEALLPKLADRGAGLFFLSRRYAQLGEVDKSLAALKECLALDEGFDPSDVPQFEPLRANPEFRTLATEAAAHYLPVHQARVAYTIPQKDLFPEGLAVDPGRKVFYMGSMLHKKILRIAEKGEASDFVPPDASLAEPNGIKVDPQDHGLWVATGDEHASELVHFDSQGKLLERFRPPEPGPHELNDLVIHNGSEIFVTDTLAHQVYRWNRQLGRLLPMSFHRPLLYPNGIALSEDSAWLYVADILGVIQVDLKDYSTREVDPGKHSTLAGIDGLYWHKGSLVGVQYGNGPYRVARWRLERDGKTVKSTEVLEYRTPLISSPTTGAILGKNFYFIANSGVENYKDGKAVDPTKLEPIQIAVIELD
ncbi:MAG TPA: hypothetical protein VJQ82_10305 [Terriglobales bacterium]|nr:hypothetical protein [Terriglobales bacterium]